MDASTLISKKPLAECKILVVDDSPDIRTLYSTILSLMGAHVSLAGNGKEALNILVERDFDVILMDLQMPVMDGYEAIKQIRLKGFNKAIITLSANNSASIMERLNSLGCQKQLVKPVAFHQLVDTISHFV